MKKCLRILFLLAIFTALLCVAALAAEPEEAGYYGVQPGEGFTVTVQDAAKAEITAAAADVGGSSVEFYAGAKRLEIALTGAADGYWLVLAQDSTELPTQSTEIKYIDQDSASGGTVSFNVYPSDDLTSGGTYYVYFVSAAGRQLAVTFTYYEPQPAYVPGDVDGAAGISVNDALFVLQAVAQLRTLEGTNLLAADVDGAAGVSVNDALFILQAVAQLRTL